MTATPRTPELEAALDEAADLMAAICTTGDAVDALENAVSCETEEDLVANLDEAKDALVAALAEVTKARDFLAQITTRAHRRKNTCA